MAATHFLRRAGPIRSAKGGLLTVAMDKDFRIEPSP